MVRHKCWYRALLAARVLLEMGVRTPLQVMLYGSGMPLLYLLGAVQCIVAFLCDKVLPGRAELGWERSTLRTQRFKEDSAVLSMYLHVQSVH